MPSPGRSSPTSPSRPASLPIAAAAECAGQLRAYAEALSAAGAAGAIERLIHLPLSGLVVTIT